MRINKLSQLFNIENIILFLLLILVLLFLYKGYFLFKYKEDFGRKRGGFGRKLTMVSQQNKIKGYNVDGKQLNRTLGSTSNKITESQNNIDNIINNSKTTQDRINELSNKKIVKVDMSSTNELKNNLSKFNKNMYRQSRIYKNAIKNKMNIFNKM